jgi:hypothetical protein
MHAALRCRWARSTALPVGPVSGGHATLDGTSFRPCRRLEIHEARPPCHAKRGFRRARRDVRWTDGRLSLRRLIGARCLLIDGARFGGARSEVLAELFLLDRVCAVSVYEMMMIVYEPSDPR